MFVSEVYEQNVEEEEKLERVEAANKVGIFPEMFSVC